MRIGRRMDELRVNIVKRVKYDNVFRVQGNDFLDIFQKKMFCDLFFLCLFSVLALYFMVRGCPTAS